MRGGGSLVPPCLGTRLRGGDHLNNMWFFTSRKLTPCTVRKELVVHRIRWFTASVSQTAKHTHSDCATTFSCSALSTRLLTDLTCSVTASTFSFISFSSCRNSGSSRATAYNRPTAQEVPHMHIVFQHAQHTTI